MVERLDLTTGDVVLLTETVNEVIDGGAIDNTVSVHVVGACECVHFTVWQSWCAHTYNTNVGEHTRVCVCACVHACVHACVRAYVCTCVLW